MEERTPVTIDLSAEHPNWTAVLRNSGDGSATTDLREGSELRASLPFRCDYAQALPIVRVYRIGHAHGTIDGGNRVRNDMLKVLGL